MGSGLYGDIGLDDIKLLPVTQGNCPSTTACTFEYGLCSFTNTLLLDDFDWSLKKGKTGTVNTGPSADHTLQTKNGELFPTPLLDVARKA